MKAFASFQTGNANRYLAMLCSHFGKRVKVQCDGNAGWVQFPFGRCELTADDTHLEMLASADDQPLLDQVVHIINSHLERFAFRENPVLDWQEPSRRNFEQEQLE